VSWKGPNNQGDYLVIRPEGANRNLAVINVNAQGTLSMTAPGEPGNYVVSYLLATGTVISSVRLEVKAGAAAVQAPAQVAAGASFELSWNGPNNKGDYLVLRPASSNRNLTILNANAEARGRMTAPGEPGSYTLSYVLASGNVVLASAPITVTPTSASIQAPAQVKAGAKFEVSWTGPNNQGDYLVIRPEGANRNLAVINVNAHGKATFTAPAQPGTYTISYALASGNE
jgi:Ca-activated chloride channel family protein